MKLVIYDIATGNPLTLLSGHVPQIKANADAIDAATPVTQTWRVVSDDVLNFATIPSLSTIPAQTDSIFQ